MKTAKFALWTSPVVVGAMNSIRKQNNPETQLTPSDLTQKGLHNTQNGFIAFIAAIAANRSGILITNMGGQMMGKAIHPDGGLFVMGNYIRLAGWFTAIPSPLFGLAYSAFKIGEGAMDLYQSPPTSLRR